jgi:hypothetical protein
VSGNNNIHDEKSKASAEGGIMSPALQEIVDSFKGDLDDALLHLYDRVKAAHTKAERTDAKALYNDLAAYTNRIRNHNSYKMMK